MLGIKSLCEKTNISQQTFYRLLRENEEFRDLVAVNKEKKGNSFRYSKAVLEWLLDYRGAAQESSITPEPSETPVTATETASAPLLSHDREKELLEKISALEAEIERLTNALDDKEQERKALFLSNGNLLMLLTQEKQEKQALLQQPQPAKLPISQRIKAFFNGGKQERKEPSAV